MKKQQNGFIALVSVIIISFVLLSLAVRVTNNGFILRYEIFNSESKEKSMELAEACIQTARLKVANDPSFTVDNFKQTVDSSHKCEFDLNNINASSKEIISHACVNNAHTYLRAEILTSNPQIPITDLEELPTSGSFDISCNL